MDTLLDDFVSFLKQEGAHHITTELCLRWATRIENTQPFTRALRLGIIRQFAQYCADRDSRTQVPPRGLLPHLYRRKSPYIYNDEEVRRLVAAAKALPSEVGLLPYTYSTLFGLIAATGLRRSEALGLHRDDVDLRNRLLTIRWTKFGKSRLVPIHQSTQHALEVYAKRRDSTCPRPKDPNFFLSDSGERPTASKVNKTFCAVSRNIGLRGPSDRHGPRLHDLRHTFAVRTLVRWYQAGADVDRHMPELSTYLGQTCVTGTYWYISAVPELLRLAMRRVAQREVSP